MEQLRKDALALCEDWADWQIVATDPAKFSITLQRSDEDNHNVIEFTASATYPRGVLKLFDTVAEHRFEAKDCDVSKALDAALEKWFADADSEMHFREGSSVIFESAVHGQMEDVLPSVLKQVEVELRALAADPQLKNLVHVSYDEVRRKWRVRIGTSLQALGSFRAKALGVNTQDLLVIEFRFPWKFLRETDIPEISDIFLSNPMHLGANSETAERHLGALRWYLKSRIEAALSKNHVLLERKNLNFTAQDDELWADRLKFQPQCKEEDFYADGNKNIFLGIQRFVAHRVAICTLRCLICDDPLSHQGLKLAICEKDLCQHSAQNYGLGCDVVHELERNPQVSELLISLTLAAAQCGQQGRDVLVPMCPVQINPSAFPDYKGPYDFYNGQYGDPLKKNFKLIADSINKLPSVKKMVTLSGGTDEGLKKGLDKLSPLLFPLLRWILSSNRAHIEPIPQHLHIKGMGPYQFHLVSSNPAKEGRFQARKAVAKTRSGASKTGSFFVWHGSAPGNWHCIARTGLKNYSNTKFMSAGAAYGPGIYTAKTINISLGYMGAPSNAWSGAEFFGAEKGLQLISLCELVDDQRDTSAVTGQPSLKDHGNEIVTIQDEDLIDTRFLFVFAGGVTCSNDLRADKMDIPAELLR